MYTVGQVAKFLGVSRDTLKFYEDKNLISPRQDEENGYRKYNIMDINDVIAVNFYRDIDIEIKKIQEIKRGDGLDTVESILLEKEIKLQEEIEYKKLLLKRIEYIRENCKDVKENLNKFSIREMKPIVVINEIKMEEEVVATYSEILEKYDFSTRIKRAVSLSGISRIIYFDSEIITKERYIFYEKLDKKVYEDSLYNYSENNSDNHTEEDREYKEDFNKEKDGEKKAIENKQFFSYPKCLYIVIAVPTENQGDNIDGNMAKIILEKANELGYETIGLSFINMLMNAYEEGNNIQYLEIYTPVRDAVHNE